MKTRIAEIILDTCLAIQPHEKVLVITDAQRYEIGEFLFRHAQTRSEAVLLQIPVTRFDGDQLSSFTAEIARHADVIIAPTTMSASHTKAMVEARLHGARVATLPGITADIFERALDVDYDAMSAFTTKLKERFAGVQHVRVTTEKGTDVTFSITGRTIHVLDGLCRTAGSFVNLPDGEMMVAPVETSMNGRIVIDLSMSPDQPTDYGMIGLLNGETIDLEIRDGRITRYGGGSKAAVLERVITAAGDNADCIAEFAIGTNPAARIIGNILEDEKVMNTIHFAFGSNVSIGGTNQSTVHLDGVIGKPTVWADGEEVMRDGEFAF